MRKSFVVDVCDVGIGGGNPVRVQSMTSTDTADIDATVKQIVELYAAGSELVRVTVNNAGAARALPEIRRQVGGVPLVGDFHFEGYALLRRFSGAAEVLDKFRINPGNVGRRDKNDPFYCFLDIAKEYDKPVRIGVNWGSLDKKVKAEFMEENACLSVPKSAEEVELDAVVASALQSAERAVDYGLAPNKIVLSAKVSRPLSLASVYERLADSQYVLHLGLTEAGMGDEGVVRSAVALAPLLLKGIGDTIRVSLTPEPGASRVREVQVAQYILQALDVRRFGPSMTSCPGCGRTSDVTFQRLAKDTKGYQEAHLQGWKASGFAVKGLEFAVMGCVVNGLGECAKADLAIMLPGDNEGKVCMVYCQGKEVAKIRAGDYDELRQQWFGMIEAYVAMRREV